MKSQIKEALTKSVRQNSAPAVLGLRFAFIICTTIFFLSIYDHTWIAILAVIGAVTSLYLTIRLRISQSKSEDLKEEENKR